MRGYRRSPKLRRRSATPSDGGLRSWAIAGTAPWEIDNNAAERALHAVALGRKNYLFAGCDSGGERAEAMYSLIGSAKLNGLDPAGYLRDVLARIADHPVCLRSRHAREVGQRGGPNTRRILEGNG